MEFLHDRLQPRPVRFGARSIETSRLADAEALLDDLFAAYQRDAERRVLMTTVDRTTHRNLVRVLHFMRVAPDRIDDAEQPTNNFDDYLNGTWDGPVPVSTVRRVLRGRIEWSPPPSGAADLEVLRRLEQQTVAGGLGRTVAEFVDDVLAHNSVKTFNAAAKWNLDGLIVDKARVHPIDPEAINRLSGATLGDPGASYDSPDSSASAEAGSRNLRRVANDLVRGAHPRNDPRLVPQAPAVLLNIAGTLDHLGERWAQSDNGFAVESLDGIPIDHLIEGFRNSMFHMLAVPALRRYDPTIPEEHLVGLSGRILERTLSDFPKMFLADEGGQL